MAAIDIEKYVSRQLAEKSGHKLSQWTRDRDTITASCRRCATEFVIDLRGTKRCATNLHIPCAHNRRVEEQEGSPNGGALMPNEEITRGG